MENIERVEKVENVSIIKNYSSPNTHDYPPNIINPPSQKIRNYIF